MSFDIQICARKKQGRGVFIYSNVAFSIFAESAFFLLKNGGNGRFVEYYARHSIENMLQKCRFLTDFGNFLVCLSKVVTLRQERS